MATTLLNLINTILRKAGQQTVTTLAGGQTPVPQAVDFLNEVYFDMLAALKSPRLQKTASFNTVAGTAAYSSATDGEVEHILLDTLRLTGESRPLQAVDELYPLRHGETATGKPVAFYFQSGQIMLYPIPNDVYTVKYSYFHRPTRLAADSDTPVIPQTWEEVLIRGAQALLEQFLGESGNASDSFAIYQQGLTRLRGLGPLRSETRMKGFYRGADR